MAVALAAHYFITAGGVDNDRSPISPTVADRRRKWYVVVPGEAGVSQRPTQEQEPFPRKAINEPSVLGPVLLLSHALRAVPIRALLADDDKTHAD
jgi:hypothetical protein